MSIPLAWLAALGTVAVLVMYELFLALTQRRHPERLARSVNVLVRQDWFDAISQHSGSEILGVQTLRNSLMSASMTASTAALGLMGSVTLAAPSLDASFGQIHQAGLPALSPRLVLELVLMVLLFASLLSSAMAVRFYNHAGFICGMPIGSEARRRWGPTGVSYLRRAGLHYSWGLRHLLLVAPILVSILFPLAGPVAAVLVVLVLYGFDRLSVP